MSKQNLQNPHMTIGDRIKEAREAKGFSQAKLAREVGVSREAVSQWESGGLPTMGNLTKIAKTTGRTLVWLTEATNDVQTPLTIRQILGQLDDVDLRSIRALREWMAQLSGAPEMIIILETEAISLRERLHGLIGTRPIARTDSSDSHKD